MRLFGRSKYTFQGGFGREIASPDGNPAKGWYSIYPFDLSDEADLEQTGYALNPEDRLALVQLNIGRFYKNELDQTALNRADEILNFFAEAGYDIILRVRYDSEGKGMENEPNSIGLIRKHMQQLGGVMVKHKDSIFVHQGLFIGSWGEMHHSKFLSAEKLLLLKESFLAATGGQVRLAVRTPQQWRILGSKEEMDNGNCFNLPGLYNDALLSSETDMGTYREIKNTDGVTPLWRGQWDRDAEFAFQDLLCRKVPNGGEVVCNNPLNDLAHAIDSLSRLHITYLNRQYDAAVLEKWKASAYQGNYDYRGKNGFQYIGAHLGYRFVVRGVRVDDRKFCLAVSVENTGFANLYDAAEVVLSFVREGSSERIESRVDTDARNWQCGTITDVCVDLQHLSAKENAACLAKGKYTVFISMHRCKDKKPIRFANEDNKDADSTGMAEEKLCLGQLAVG